MKKTNLVLVGIGGYGTNYVRELLEAHPVPEVHFAAAIDPYPEKSHLLDPLKAAKVPILASLDDWQGPCDLLINTTPIHLHRPISCAALRRGTHVLCEKPAAATIQDAYAMIDASRQADRFVAIGYQWSFSDQVQLLKQDILKGRFGKPIRLKTIVCWPRPASYYQRNGWAGALKTSSGDWVLDSPLNNATAHFLHNMFFLLGDAPDRSGVPVSIQAECYRANAIRNYDTAMLRCRTAPDTEILFYTSHAVSNQRGPVMEYVFEQGTIRFDADKDPCLRAHFKDGSTFNYGSPDQTTSTKLWRTIDAVRNHSTPVCGLEACIPHTLCVNGAQESTPAPHPFPPDIVKVSPWKDSDTITAVDDLPSVMEDGYDNNTLPSESPSAPPWAVAGKTVDLLDYRTFPRPEVAV